MDRRNFIETCTHRAACLGSVGLSAVPGLPGIALAANLTPKTYERVALTDEQGHPLKTAKLLPNTNYLFHYPFEATPVFLLKLDQRVLPQHVLPQHLQGKTTAGPNATAGYTWPGGVGPQQSVVAFSAICAHHLVYPTQQVSFISFRKSKAQKGLQDNLIHCCADHSQYDPAKGAQVLSGPAPQPLCAILLEHHAKTDSLTAYATLGGELFDEFFQKYAFKLSLEVGPNAKNAVKDKAVVRPLDKFCRNPIQC